MNTPRVQWPRETRSKEERLAFEEWADLRNEEIARTRLEISGLRAMVTLGRYYVREIAARAGVIREPHQSLGVFCRGFRT